MSPRKEWCFNMTGWLLFTSSAVFYIWSSARAGDGVAVIASLLFLAACIVFMIPAWRLRPPRNQD
jgi:hypothetical protein